MIASKSGSIDHRGEITGSIFTFVVMPTMNAKQIHISVCAWLTEHEVNAAYCHEKINVLSALDADLMTWYLNVLKAFIVRLDTHGLALR